MPNFKYDVGPMDQYEKEQLLIQMKLNSVKKEAEIEPNNEPNRLIENEEYNEVEGLPTEKPIKEPELTIEDKARAQGWRPKSEYKGDQDLWRDAREFLHYGSLLKENKRLADMVTETAKIASKAREYGHQQALREIEESKKAAMALGDFQRYDQLKDQENKLKAEPVGYNTTPPAELKRELPPELANNHRFKEFQITDPWVNGNTAEDRIKLKAAEQIAKEFYSNNPNASISEELDYVHTEIRNQFKFPNDNSDNDRHNRSTVRPVGVSQVSTRDKKSSESSTIAGLGRIDDYETVVVKLQQKGLYAVAGVVKQLGSRGKDYKEYLTEVQKKGLIK